MVINTTTTDIYSIQNNIGYLTSPSYNRGDVSYSSNYIGTFYIFFVLLHITIINAFLHTKIYNNIKFITNEKLRCHSLVCFEYDVYVYRYLYITREVFSYSTSQKIWILL